MFYVVEYLLHCLEQIYYSGILLFYWMIFVASSVKEFCCLMVKSRIFLMWCDNSTFVWFSFDSRRWITVLSIRLNVNWSRWMLHHGSRQLINYFKSEIKKKKCQPVSEFETISRDSHFSDRRCHKGRYISLWFLTCDKNKLCWP